MNEHHPLKTLLNIHLASDRSAVLHLPFVLGALIPESLSPSPHLPKWTARIQTLLHSKEPGGRWAGLVLAQNTASMSKTLFLENGQSWIGVALPLLSSVYSVGIPMQSPLSTLNKKNEPSVVLKAAIRLLQTIFTRSYEVSEFRRQVATPNIPKLLVALMSLSEQTSDIELKIIAIATLANLVPLYPTLHKASYPALFSLALRFLDGHPHTPVTSPLLNTASRLYCIIHVTGGKVGASTLWRKSLDETLKFGTNAFWCLRTTFNGAPTNAPASSSGDPTTSVPLHLERLKCSITILVDLLSSIVYRPVQIPLGEIVRFILLLLKCTDNKKDGFVDASIHSLELTTTSKIQELGCSLVVSLATKVKHHLQPYSTQLMGILAVHLETRNTGEHCYIILQALQTLLLHYSSSSPMIATRLMKGVLPLVSKILRNPNDTRDPILDSSVHPKGRKGKKRAQMFETEELFTSVRSTIYPSESDGKIVLIALEAIRLLLRDPHLDPSIGSVSIRVLISVLLVIERMPPATLSSDYTLYQDLVLKLRSIGTEFASGNSSTLSKSLPLISNVLVCSGETEFQRQLELLLHPRLPPLVWSMPLAEKLSLFFSDESREEGELRKSLGLRGDQDEVHLDADVEMSDSVACPRDQPPLAIPMPKETFPNTEPNTLSTSLVAPPKTNRNESTGKETSEHMSIHAQEAAEKSSSHPTTIEPFRAPPPEVVSTSTQKMSAYRTLPPVEDEDEDIPAIDMDSDSDFE